MTARKKRSPLFNSSPMEVFEEVVERQESEPSPILHAEEEVPVKIDTQPAPNRSRPKRVINLSPTPVKASSRNTPRFSPYK
jgi:hypothetical protein